MESVYAHIDANTQKYIDRLGEAIAIPSISGDASHRSDVFRMGAWLKTELVRLGFSAIEEHLPGKQTLQGHELDLPPVVLATFGEDNNKPTVLVYGHYDVQPALKDDGWKYEPFQMVHEKETGRIYGRGSTDDKAPILSWLWVVEAYKALGKELPVNLKVCFEGMEESGSEGLDDIIFKEADRYFKNVDCVCISDN
ncbi:hypothetical protein HDU99_009747, partial [Rhizoclosmatium hyalinum]